MQKYRLWVAIVFALGTAAVVAPMSIFAATKSSTAPAPAKVLKGKLASYTPGSNAIFWAKSTKVSVKLKFHTKLTYAGKSHAAPFPAPGDAVTMQVRSIGGTNTAASMTYNNPGTTAGGKEQGTSRFHGAYDAAGSSATVIATKDKNGTVETFAVTANTLYFEDGQQVSAPTLTDGEHLGIEATQQSDGSWAADSVIVGDHVGDHGGLGQAEDFSGLYVSNTDTTLTVSVRHNLIKRTFTIDANTKYFDQHGQPVSSLTYTAGERVHVSAAEQADGTWLASSVGAEDSHGHGGCDHGGDGNNHHFKGAYQASDATSVTVIDEHGNTEIFTIDANTLYFDQNGNQVPGLTYAAGETLFIRAAHQSDGTWLATAISLKDQGDGGGGKNSDDFGGVYSADSPTSLTILDDHGNSEAFTLDANTQYIDQTGQPASSLTYTTGERLHVEATKQSDGSWLATLVSAFHDGGGH